MPARLRHAQQFALQEPKCSKNSAAFAQFPMSRSLAV
jgi:hypothetical protein